MIRQHKLQHHHQLFSGRTKRALFQAVGTGISSYLFSPYINDADKLGLKIGNNLADRFIDSSTGDLTLHNKPNPKFETFAESQARLRREKS